MMLPGRTAVVYGAGPMSRAVAQAFVGAGASVHLASRGARRLDALAAEVDAVSSVLLDARDPAAVDAHLAGIAGVDLVFNGLGTDAVQGVPLAELSLADFLAPVTASMSAHLAIGAAAARHLADEGALVHLSASASREWRHQMGGFSVANAAVETFTRTLAAEVGPRLRVVCLRANFTPETYPEIDVADLRSLIDDTMTGRLPRLAEIGQAAVFAACAGSTTGVVIDLSGGATVG